MNWALLQVKTKYYEKNALPDFGPWSPVDGLR